MAHDNSLSFVYFGPTKIIFGSGLGRYCRYSKSTALRKRSTASTPGLSRLACMFAEDRAVAECILEATESGGAMVNDCAIQGVMPELPFGGVGNSGMGKYHGKWGFHAHTNARGVMYHSSKLDPNVRYTSLFSPTDSWLHVLFGTTHKKD